MKKVFIVFLVFAYMNCYLGCYYSTKTTVIPVDEFDAKSKPFDESSPISNDSTITYEELNKSTNENAIKVTTRDSTEYFFDIETYRVLNDTLYGYTKIDDRVRKIKVSRSDILSILVLNKDYKIDYDNVNLSLMTKDSVFYVFESGDYIYKNDTLEGEGYITPYEDYDIYGRHYRNLAAIEKKFYKIPIKDIDTIKINNREISVVWTTFFVLLGISVIAFGILAVSVATQLDWK